MKAEKNQHTVNEKCIRLWIISLAFLGFLSIPTLAPAAEPVPGNACSPTGKMIRTGEGNNGYFMVCNGSAWVSLTDYKVTGRSLMQFDNETGACNASKKGMLSYEDTTDTWKYCTGTAWKKLNNSTAIDSGTPGTPQGDNTILAGYPPPSFEPIYTTRCNIGFTWDGAACNNLGGATYGFTYGSNANLRGTSSSMDGKRNTNILASFGSTAHPAAWACDSLVADGYSDWYLPSEIELLTMQLHVGMVALPNDIAFMSSNERDTSNAMILWAIGGPASAQIVPVTKSTSTFVRCVRKN